jgi:hypothetical protein
MLSVVHSSDCSKLEFIQPHPLFVAGDTNGRLCPHQAERRSRSVRLACAATDQMKKSEASAKAHPLR